MPHVSCDETNTRRRPRMALLVESSLKSKQSILRDQTALVGRRDESSHERTQLRTSDEVYSTVKKSSKNVRYIYHSPCLCESVVGQRIDLAECQARRGERCLHTFNRPSCGASPASRKSKGGGLGVQGFRVCGGEDFSVGFQGSGPK